MKKIIILVATVFLLNSCTTFGNFSNLKQAESTQENVRTMLGEPSSKQYEGEHEVWQYQFNKKNEEVNDNMRTNINLKITFKDKKADNYYLSVSKETVKEAQKEKNQEVMTILQPSQTPSQPIPKEKSNFIIDLDRDNDGRVSRSEFPGPDKAFNNFDKNKDGFIDETEAPQGQKPMQKEMPQRGKGRF